MEKPQIVFHVLMENGYEVGLIEQTLRSTDYDASFVAATEETLMLSENASHILLLEPSMSHWEWLDILIQVRSEHPDLFIILYSRDISVKDDFQSLPGQLPVFLTGDVTVLKDNMERIIDEIKRKEEPKKSVLFVDDEPNILSSYTRMLRKSPWNVFTAPSAEKALETLQKEPIDLVVTDMKMPQTHGIELVSKIRENFRKLPIIVCSGYSGMKDDQSLQFNEIAAFVEKPVDPEVLKSKIGELLG